MNANRLWENDYIVQVYETRAQIEFTKQDFELSLRDSLCICKTKWHLSEPVNSRLPRECDPITVIFNN